MNYKRGDVLLVPFPFTDLAAIKQRPGLVVSPDVQNTSRDDLIVAAITSQINAPLALDEVLVPTSELANWGLPKPSVVKLGKLFTMHQGLVRKQIGHVPPATMKMILELLQLQFQP